MEDMIRIVQSVVKDFNILFVEDDETLIENITPILEELFLSFSIARNGKEGLELYQKEEFDLIITDIRMPVMDGLEMIKEIRKTSKSQKIMVISAHREAEFFVELISLGIKSFMLKPFDLEQFLISLKECYEDDEVLEIAKPEFLLKSEINYPKKELEPKGIETILAVDDTAENLSLISDLLKEKYKIKVAKSGQKALDYLQKSENPDLILLDIMMPEMDGYDVIKELKNTEKTQDIPVIFLTAKSSIEDEKEGLNLGAEDYITKPISPVILQARVKTQLQSARAKKFLKTKNEYLEKEIDKRTREISAIQNVSIQVLSSLAETRDQETGSHIKRTQLYVKLLAKYLSTFPKFSEYLTPEFIKVLYISAPLHDIGKVGIPDHILLKPGKLTADEFEVMKTHSVLGKESIERAETELGYEVDFLKTAKDIAYLHHERYDGSGYPLGLKGEEIPLSARLMAIADVYDAYQ